MYTAYQTGYFAHWLSLEGEAEKSLTQTIASAKVDMNPHQVEAALFALASPLSNGVILADEVGLGKTIEASLVLAQKWAERKRKLLLIVPATLRKQWSQELEEKFSLLSIILEAKNFNALLKSGVNNPFDSEGKSVVICSYEFAARKDLELARVPWDMVVLDEAHKLRNIYKTDGAKTAKKLEFALKGRSKVMLSATPLQNNLQELYGLTSIIDPHFFGDLESFKARYCRPKLDEAEFALLRSRLKKICSRTLRRQVQEEGGIKFTKRYSLTEDFRPGQEELNLYSEVSSYLQQDDLLAIKPGARHLVTLVIRKILASSAYAIQGTLETMIDRLEKKLPLIDALQDYETTDDLTDSNDITDDDLIDAKALQAEIDKLKDFKQLASDITQNSKFDALLRVLGKAFDFTERLGGARKAVIFTESVRTQAWLCEHLSEQGYLDQLVLLNGSNSDANSKQIYQAWLKKHHDSSRVSGSKSSDMKAALVDKFRDDAGIMICTEAGAEGINLQFCSLLINYDLPWNPQRVEQRIGRVHRYGQKHDVVVVNFINKGNRADERVFELLSLKFKLFEGVFGASDEILGSIESGMDIERRIHDIYQKCRNDEQIEEEFNRLQAEFQTDLEARSQDTRRSLLENFDVDVVKRLNLRRDKTLQHLNDYQQRLLQLARMSMPEAHFNEHCFFYTPLGSSEGIWYDVNWQSADDSDAKFFRPNEGLGKDLIEQAKAQLVALNSATTPVELVFEYNDQGNGQYSDLKALIGQSGELVLEKMILKTANQTIEHLLPAACTTAGETLDPETIDRLLELSVQKIEPDAKLNQTALLDNQLKALDADCVHAAAKDNERYYDEETEKLDRWAEDRRIALDIRIKQLDQEIKEARKASRQLPTLKEKMEAKKILKQRERERDNLMLDYHEEKKKIEAEEDRLLAGIEAALEMSQHRERLFAIRWQLVGKTS
ncbi:SNF2-related protein [Methylobacter tundripaludum]|uniref:SNF2-related protein n=1 Tax=Methylobacter tundripaludum TaxID=173365 RepID=UPI00047F29B6|nr:SNF2-related protein [Methylobacter tundripaludum]